MNDLQQAGIVTLNSKVNRMWHQEAAKILEAIQPHQTSPSGYKHVAPVRSAQGLMALRADLMTASPRLAEFVDEVRKQLVSACAVFIPKVGFEGLDENSRALMAYAVSVGLGTPTATDTKQVIWDVKARKHDSTYFSTFSETDLEAAFHTDTQYYPVPEQTFLLYCMEPAHCGGGASSVCDARALRRDIETTEKWISDVLSDRLLPFRVPSAFVTIGDPDAVQATLAPVFSETPLIRYRRDTLAEGLLHFPEYADRDAHRALDAFEAHLSACRHKAEFFLPRDGLIVVDNHRALHARTAFQDPDRHLLRIRLQWDGPTQHATRHRMVTRGIDRIAVPEEV